MALAEAMLARLAAAWSALRLPGQSTHECCGWVFVYFGGLRRGAAGGARRVRTHPNRLVMRAAHSDHAVCLSGRVDTRFLSFMIQF